MKLSVIQKNQCDCGAEMVSMSIAHDDMPERCRFACGLELIVRGGNPSNYSIETWIQCRNSSAKVAERQRWLEASTLVKSAIDSSALLPNEKERFKAVVSGETDWRCR